MPNSNQQLLTEVEEKNIKLKEYDRERKHLKRSEIKIIGKNKK